MPLGLADAVAAAEQRCIAQLQLCVAAYLHYVARAFGTVVV